MSRPLACSRPTYRSASSAAAAAVRRAANRRFWKSLPASCTHVPTASDEAWLETARDQVQIKSQHVEHQADDENEADGVKRYDELLVCRSAAYAFVGKEYKVPAVEQRYRQEVEDREIGAEHR